MTDERRDLELRVDDQAAHVAALTKRLELATAYEEELHTRLVKAHERIVETDERNLRLRAEAEDREARLADAASTIQARDEGIRWLRSENAAIVEERDGLASAVASEAEVVRSLRAECERHARQCAELERVIAARDEGIAWLRDELAMTRDHWLRRGWARWIQSLRARLGHSSRSEAGLLGSPAASAGAASVGDPASRLAEIVLLPEVTAETLRRILDLPPRSQPSRRPDVIGFSIIDWDFRFQRPQQILSQFADHGHRVFWITPTAVSSPDDPKRFSLRWIRPNVCEIRLAASRLPNVYAERIPADEATGLLASLDALRRELGVDEAISFVSIASWTDVALAARRRFGWTLVYDCMDDWAHFKGIGPAVVDAESELVAEADLVVVTAERLREKWESHAGRLVLARNGADVGFYERELRPSGLLAGLARPIVGYFGAIADWFDLDLVADVAERRPQYSFVLVGGVFSVDVSRLERLPNVHLLDQRPYGDMPKYLHDFDACLIPFKRNAVTHATDPVKYYEYLCAGKPVVAVALDELAPYREDHYCAETTDEFVAELDRAVSENDPERVERRKSFARRNRWTDRYAQIEGAIRPLTAKASIVVITYENLPLTQLCLESILCNTEHGNYEIVVVDNASRDATPSYLRELERRHEHVSIILNADNRGFPRAVNQGLERASGEHLVILNNDVVVPPGWLNVLIRHLRDPAIGLVGPMTNFAGNEARIEVPYTTVAAMESFARERRWQEEGKIADITVLAMFCVAMRRDVFAAVGTLDESFGIGMFEDDDYSNRVRKAGFRVVCAADAFVHHVGQAAFKDLIARGEYDALFRANRSRFEQKWSTRWIPHRVAALDFIRSKRRP